VVTGDLEILNTEAHRHLRIAPGSGVAHPHFVMIVIGEFPAAASNCPIFFAKDPATAEFYAGALFGFEPGETLFEAGTVGEGEGGIFRPLELQRQGFFMADENIAIDPNHARFGAGASIALFDDAGTPTQAMRKIQSVIGQLHAGVEATRAFIAELLRLRLVEPIDISLRFDDGAQLQLDGLYTVSRDALNELPDADVARLFRNGYLQAALCMTFSLNQVAVLARRRNARLSV
jgi:hypothetical protein